MADELDYGDFKAASIRELGAASGCSVFGEVAKVLTQQLVRRVRSACPTLAGTNLGELSVDELHVLSREVWATSGDAGDAMRRIVVPFASWLASFHDRSNDNALRGSCAEGLFQWNDWDLKQAQSLLLPIEQVEVVDFCYSISLRGSRETKDIEAAVGVKLPELTRRHAGLVMRHLLGSTADTTIVTSWDSDAYHRYLWWSLTGSEHEPWCGTPYLAMAKLGTLGEGYEGGATRLLALGLHCMFVVPQVAPLSCMPLERNVMRTLRIPKSEGLWSRPVCTVGGHVGSVVARAVVRDIEESKEEAAAAAREGASMALAGTSRMTPQVAVDHLRRHGQAERAADTTPAIARTKHHNDNLIWAAFEEQLRFPVLTRLGNLNRVPELEAAVHEAANDMTWRRRLVPFQQAMGVEPPDEFYRFDVPRTD